MIPPDRNRRAAETAVYRLMIGTDDVERDVALELPQSQRCMPLRIVFATFLAGLLNVVPGSRCSFPICVPIRRSIWPPNRGSPGGRHSIAMPASWHPLLKARLRKSAPLSTCSVSGQTGDGPWFLDLAFPQPRRLVEDGMQ